MLTFEKKIVGCDQTLKAPVQNIDSNVSTYIGLPALANGVSYAAMVNFPKSENIK